MIFLMKIFKFAKVTAPHPHAPLGKHAFIPTAMCKGYLKGLY